MGNLGNQFRKMPKRASLTESATEVRYGCSMHYNRWRAACDARRFADTGLKELHLVLNREPRIARFQSTFRKSS
jgi:hypothetical protein